MMSKPLTTNFVIIDFPIPFDPPDITSNLFFINLDYNNNLRNCKLLLSKNILN